MAATVNAHGAQRSLGEGNKTQTIYGLINSANYAEAARLLSNELLAHPQSRAALSLLGYCQYMAQDYEAAAVTYNALIKVCPESEEYKVHLAQALLKAGKHADAAKAALQVSGQQHSLRMLQLQATAKYEQDDLAGAKALVDKCVQHEPDTLVARGCLLFKEGAVEQARLKFTEALNAVGYSPDIAYNIALCHYRKGEYGQALRVVAEMIDRGVRQHPELGVGSKTDGLDVRSVGNSQALKETALVEAFNLRAAIEFQTGHLDAAREALTDMPPRSEEELDHVTLHNHALLHMDTDPTGGFRKLSFLLSQPPFPPETFGNLLLLYIRHQYYDLAADVMADNAHLHQTCLSQTLFDYIDATILSHSSPPEAFRKLESLAKKHTEELRRITKQIQDARLAQSNERTKAAMLAYEEALERFVPVLMAQAKIYWDTEHYAMVEKIFKQSVEFCSEHEVWKLNVAHVFFMQEKFADAILYYEPIVQKKADNLLDITAIVLANLCVSYIMTQQNERAEELMRRIEKREEEMAREQPSKHFYHLCIVNLVIGTLYCSKGNFEFGLSRVMKSLEPYQAKLGPDTWFYAKRCFVAVLDALAKHMLVFKDKFFIDVLAFLDGAERHGKGISTVISAPGGAAPDPHTHNVASEARLLKHLFLRHLQ